MELQEDDLRADVIALEDVVAAVDSLIIVIMGTTDRRTIEQLQTAISLPRRWQRQKCRRRLL